MKQTATATAAVKDIFVPQLPLDRIQLSPTNPRKHITEAEIDELAASIREHGVVQPIVVRPHPQLEKGWFQIVAGERRFRASVKAGKADIPAMIRALTDVQALEITLVENVQRKDVHELDEANGYKSLIDSGLYDVKSLALRISKSKEIIYKRLKLIGAIAEIQQLFYDGNVTAAHVEQIARLPEVSQRVVLEKGLFKKVRNTEGEWRPLTLAEVLGDEDHPPLQAVEREAVSTRDLDAFIHQHVYSDLGAAVFDIDDAQLFAEAGACTACPKRFGNTCGDRACFHRKTNAFVGDALQATMDTLKMGNGRLYWSHHAPWPAGSCAHLQTLICIDGPRRGEKKLVCIHADCETHHPKPKPAAPPPAPPVRTPKAESTISWTKPRSLVKEYQEAKRKTVDQTKGFDKDQWLQELGELRNFADRTLDFVEQDQLFLARGSAEAACSRAEHIRAALNIAVDDLGEEAAPAPRRARSREKVETHRAKIETMEDALCRLLGRDRWNAARKTGLTNAELRRKIGAALGIAGGHSGPGLTPIQYAGLTNPRFWWNAESGTRRKPTLQGASLVAKVRELLRIPYPRVDNPAAPKREKLFTCPKCRIPNFTKRGLAAHVCEAKVSTRTKVKKAGKR